MKMWSLNLVFQPAFKYHPTWSASCAFKILVGKKGWKGFRSNTKTLKPPKGKLIRPEHTTYETLECLRCSWEYSITGDPAQPFRKETINKPCLMRNSLPVNKASNLVPERREGRGKDPRCGFEEVNSGYLRV